MARSSGHVARNTTGGAALPDPKPIDFLRKADPVLARVIDARGDFRPRTWLDDLPPLDGFGGRMPSADELLAADPQVLRDSGFSTRKGQTLRAVAERFVDGRLSDEALAGMSDEDVEATLTEVPGIGLWTARGFLLVALDRPDVFLSGDLALRRVIQRTYGFDHLPTEDEIIEVSDRWRPHRSLAVSYLFASEYQGNHE